MRNVHESFRIKLVKSIMYSHRSKTLQSQREINSYQLKKDIWSALNVCQTDSSANIIHVLEWGGLVVMQVVEKTNSSARKWSHQTGHIILYGRV